MKLKKPFVKNYRLVRPLLLASALMGGLCAQAQDHRVLLISIDGMHAVDVARFVREHTNSAMATLVRSGVNYTRASGGKPADSFPGMLAIATGGSPASTGVYFDLSYDRSLWPPGRTNGPKGTVVAFNETVDFNPNVLDGGGGLDPSKLPRDPARGGAVVYPHNYLRVNTIFEVAKAAGYRTAWSDKHLADEMIQGPSGQGVDDLYVLEINASNEFGTGITKSLELTKGFDDMKVQGILNQIRGFDHTGTTKVGVPTIFGMNFQSVSVGQRLKTNKTPQGNTANGSYGGPGGYLDGSGAPTPVLEDALSFVDGSIQKIIDSLRANGLFDSTYFILTAKHGQSPIDPTKLNIVDPNIIPSMIDPLITHVLLTGGDDAALLWLQDQSKTAEAVSALLNDQDSTHIQNILANDTLKLYYPDPLVDPRTPDIIAIGKPGAIYTTAKKIAEHGGFNEDDVNVPIVISNPALSARTIKTPVTTTQLAPTILQLLGLNPFALQAVIQEHTAILPSFEAASLALQNPLIPSFSSKTNGPVQINSGQADFQVLGVRTQTFVLQASSNLTNWTSISTNALIVGAVGALHDNNARSFTNRFYRAVAQ
jgi:hypothetical protein